MASLNIRRTLYRITPIAAIATAIESDPPGWKARWLSATSDWRGHPRNS